MDVQSLAFSMQENNVVDVDCFNAGVSKLSLEGRWLGWRLRGVEERETTPNCTLSPPV